MIWCFRFRIASALFFSVQCATVSWADLRVCNMTSSRVGIALGYKVKETWRTEGWWNMKPNECGTLLGGNLSSRYYYVYGQDYDRGGEWSGSSAMCTRDKEFAINGIEDCLARGFDKAKFFEVDTGEQKNWTIQLTDPSRIPAK